MNNNNERYNETLRFVYDILKYDISECYLVKPIIDAKNLADDLRIAHKDLRIHIEESFIKRIEQTRPTLT